MDRLFVTAAFIFAILGMILGIVMAASQNHAQHVTHAHILLLGFVMSFIYALCHRLWLPGDSGKLSWIQAIFHLVGSFLMGLGLFLIYGGIANPPTVEPVLKVSSLLVLVGAILMLVIFLKAGKTQPEAA